MWLAIPGKIESISGDEPFQRQARVNFDSIVKQVSLAYAPEANVGDYVLVHVGFAISTISESEAERSLAYLREMGELED